MKKRFVITALAYNKRGRLLSIGKNQYAKTHPIQKHFADKAYKPCCIFLHAEIDALIKASERVYKLVVMRYDSKGNPVNAKPCKICQLAINHFKVKVVAHT